MLDDGESYHDLGTLIREKARRNGSKPALRFDGVTFSYSELDEMSDRVAGGLGSSTLARGDRLAALLFNSPEFPLLWFGLAKVGAIFVPLNTGLKGELLRYELEDCQPRAIVIDQRLWDAYAPLRSTLHIEREWVVPARDGASPAPEGTRDWSELLDGKESPEAIQIAAAEPAEILYTSGTTGPPKGAVIPHEKVLQTSREIGLRSRLESESVLFTALPLFHCNAQEMTTLTALLNDLTAAFDERFHATTFWETAARFRATHVSLLISMINVLFKQPVKPTDSAHSVRTALTAGTTRTIWREFEERFHLTVIELYGMTECGCTTLMNPPHAIRLGSVGTPLGFVEADVVDDFDHPVPPNTRGELVVRPRRPFSMFLEYYRKPEATVLAWRNLWFHTGDFVTRDPDGYFYFVDRKKDVIRRRGENLAPYDVETALQRHPAVLEAVVVGVPSPLGEEDVKAFVQLKPGATASPHELFEFCARELPFFMVPRYLEFLAEIPKTANQKAQRFRLRERPPGEQYDREAMDLLLKPPR